MSDAGPTALNCKFVHFMAFVYKVLTYHYSQPKGDQKKNSGCNVFFGGLQYILIATFRFISFPKNIDIFPFFKT